ncbi:GNAT family N-acetyltransferase [Sutterella sp.]|uniref:GNAT family N-acetyltransferase n=1 Tax=Sutterella sp. TaxID=1981025 RepID=UPI0026E0A7F4|nr:GNAT family N-acetyltransferase [Sutterella sp.]MDO5531765.1 GNAT family N-acetyltransferase [Sutterella sp.]
MTPNLRLRTATRDDLETVAKVIAEVSEGITDTLFQGVIAAMPPEKVLELAFSRSISTYTPENVILAEVDGRVGGLLFSYAADEQQVPGEMRVFLKEERIRAVEPVLTAKVENALWVNTLWVSESLRGAHLGALLIRFARKTALDRGLSTVGLFCWADNEAARRFYLREGFTAVQTIRAGEFGEALRNRHPAGGIVFSMQCPAGAAGG